MTAPSSLPASVKATLSGPLVLGAGDAAESFSLLLRALEVAGGETFLVSLLLLDEQAGVMRCLAAPSLPKAYCAAIDGAPIGPNAGSCGTAAYLGHAIFVTDIEHDPHWADYKDLALSHGLRACWSTPIEDWRGRVLGTFAVYHREPTSPTFSEVEAIGLAAKALMPLLATD